MASIDASVKITNGTALSGYIDIRGFVVVGLVTPAAWTAADITFQSCAQAASTVPGAGITGDPGVFYDLFTDQGVEVKIPTAGIPIGGGRFFAFNSVNFGSGAGLNVEYLKIRSGVTGVPVNQAADRVVTLVLATNR